MGKIKNWTKSNRQTNFPTVLFFGNEKKGGVVWVLDLRKHPSQRPKGMCWQVGGVNGRGYRKQINFITKQKAIDYATEYVRSHPNG